MNIGTKSVLFGAHQFLIHPWFVAAAWTKLYGAPTDPRLWVAFFVHDLGYVGKPNMDGPEGESHVEFGALIMGKLFDRIDPVCHRCEGDGQYWTSIDTSRFDDGPQECEYCHQWERFSRYHSRFYSKRDRQPFSRLCVADKLAVALEPWWFYLPRVILSGEIHEYMALAGGKGNSKYKGEPNSKYVSMHLQTGTVRGWHTAMTTYLREWVDVHKDLRPDTWTPDTDRKVASR